GTGGRPRGGAAGEGAGYHGARARRGRGAKEGFAMTAPERDRGLERTDGRVRRREFLRTTAGAIGIAPGLATARRGAAQASRPVRGGVLKVALGTEPSSLDNHQTTDTLVALTMFHVH